MENIKNENVWPLLEHAENIGRSVGFADLTGMHGEWIQEMVFGEEDYTLQAHRGSFKSSCLAVAIALLMVLYPRRNIIFLRKTDSNVAEMMTMVSKILGSQVMKGICSRVHRKKPLKIVSESLDHISTNLWHSPMGSYQLQGFGMRTSITGKHAFYVITDDICNIDDRISRAERQHTIADELQNIRNRGGRIINLGTPWHKDDVFCRMPNIHRYDCYTTGLISPAQLDVLRSSMPPSMFAANYELKHLPRRRFLRILLWSCETVFRTWTLRTAGRTLQPLPAESGRGTRFIFTGGSGIRTWTRFWTRSSGRRSG